MRVSGLITVDCIKGDLVGQHGMALLELTGKKSRSTGFLARFDEV